MPRRPKRKTDWTHPSSIGIGLRRLGLAKYSEYLASEHWQEVRRLYRSSSRPQRCACGATGRHLHHLTYERLGAELMTDLLRICGDCHRLEHGIKGGKKRAPAVRKRKKLGRIKKPILRDTAVEASMRRLEGL